jgi:hypothetical protein
MSHCCMRTALLTDAISFPVVNLSPRKICNYFSIRHSNRCFCHHHVR